MTFGDFLGHAVKMLAWILGGSLVAIIGLAIMMFGLFHNIILMLFGIAILAVGVLAVFYGTRIHNVEPY